MLMMMMMMMRRSRTQKLVAKEKKAKKTKSDYPPACFTLSQEEIEQFFTCLLGVKLPYGYAGKISRYLDPAK